MDETAITSSNIPDHRADHTPSPNDSLEVDVIVESYSQLKMRLEHYRQLFHGEVHILRAIDSVINEISDVEAFGLSEIYQTFQPILNPDIVKIRKFLIMSCKAAINQFNVEYKAISAKFQSKFLKAKNEIEHLLLLLKSFNMNISSEPSIETLPEHYTNGIVDIDMNVINDQTIANFCSDTVRELNNLTEELQHTNLDNDFDFRINGDRQQNVHHRQIPNHTVENFANINHSSLYRRRQSSLNSKNLPTYAEVVGNQSTSRSDSVSPVPINSKLSLANTNRPSPIPKLTSIRPSLSAQTSATNISVISCPDGLAHTLSEQNLRLQQIVHEHKIREEALQKELQALRLALLRKRTCSNCSTGQGNNAAANVVDETNSLIDNGIENVSICSWEAVEERSGASSIKNSTNALNASSVLWAPDHAVSRCQTEFWLGRRKHHCRSCGQIFCADCSEFWASLPDEHLYTPVRLCGPCYHAVTTKSYEQNTTINHGSMSSSNHVRNTNLHCLSNPSTSSTTLECKNSMVTSKSDQSPTKATTVMN